MTQPRPGERGFTLIEMLVTLALVAMLTGALVGFVRIAAATWDRVAQRTAATDGLVRLDRTVRRQLSAIVQAGALGEVVGQPPLFFGSYDGFGWVARTPAQAMRPGLYGQRIRAVPGQGLILESWPIERPEAIETAPLAPAEGISFAYFGSVVPGEPSRWHRRWAAGPIPPRLVRIDFPAASTLPPLSIALP